MICHDMPCHVQAQWCGELPIEGVVQGVPWWETAWSREQLFLLSEAFTWAWVKAPEGRFEGRFEGQRRGSSTLRIQAMVAGNCEGSVSQVKASLQAGRREPLFYRVLLPRASCATRRALVICSAVADGWTVHICAPWATQKFVS